MDKELQEELFYYVLENKNQYPIQDEKSLRDGVETFLYYHNQNSRNDRVTLYRKLDHFFQVPVQAILIDQDGNFYTKTSDYSDYHLPLFLSILKKDIRPNENELEQDEIDYILSLKTENAFHQYAKKMWVFNR